MFVARLILCCVSYVLLLSLTLSRCKGEQEKLTLEEPWQVCNIFLAPSSTGWGVFAARDFEEGESLEVSALSVPMSVDLGDIIVRTSILDDYVYGYHRHETEEYTTIALHGASMFFNHHPEPNIEVTTVTDSCVVRTLHFGCSSDKFHPTLVPISVLFDRPGVGPSKWFSRQASHSSG